MVVSEDTRAVQWLHEGPPSFHASLLPYRGRQVQLTHLLAVYSWPPYARLISLHPEVIFPQPMLLDGHAAAQKIRNLRPTHEWESIVRQHQALINEQYPEWAGSDRSLEAIAEQTAVQHRLPLVMMLFGTTMDGEDVMVFWTHVTLRLDRALPLLQDACRHIQ